MEKLRWSWMVVWFIAACAVRLQTAAGQEAGYRPAPGPLAVKSVLLDWTDDRRDRDIPVKIYYPDVTDGRFPVIIFSHGVGGSRNGYAFLGEYWASFGYVCVHIQHVGSDDTILQGLPPDEVVAAMARATVSPENIMNRPLDVRFTISKLEKLNRDDPLLKGRMDLDHIGVAGHSFGAFTTLAVAGEVFTSASGRVHDWSDPRVKAAIAMSESAPRDPDLWDEAFARISIPMMHLAGTLDVSPVGGSRVEDRRVPFDHIPAVADQYLIILQGGDHMVFSGRSPSGPLAGTGNPAMDPTFQVMIQQSTTAFWDAYLKSDEKAKTWLAGGACKTMLGENGDLEIKPARGR